MWCAGAARARSGGRWGLKRWLGGGSKNGDAEVEGRAEARDWAGGRWRFEEDRQH